MLFLIAIHTAIEETGVAERVQGSIARYIGGEVPRGMAHKTEANVVKAHAFMAHAFLAHMVGTTVHRSQKPEIRGTLARPVAPRFRMISVTDVEELIIGPAPVVHERKL
ncbi:hypothetical protein M0R45_026044 [Rubus argutus]|uniref:Uncharacterized protein n=1 Tax=Rubus argutus TaxID=59490 RepID=A0AAW1WVW6_RUBAR